MSRPRLLLYLSGIAFVVSQLNLAHILAPLQPNLFALQLAFNANDFWRVIQLWGDSGLAIYRYHFVFDNIHPFIYGAFGYLLIANTPIFQHAHAVVRKVMLFAIPVAAAFDLAENALHIFILAHPPGLGGQLILLSAICSSLKWGIAAVFSLIVAFRVCLMLWAKLTTLLSK